MKRFAAMFVIGLVGVGAAVAPPTGAAAPKPRVAWRPCTGEDTEGFDCATFRVPLDHDQPNGRKISLHWLAGQQPIRSTRNDRDPGVARLGAELVDGPIELGGDHDSADDQCHDQRARPAIDRRAQQ